MPNVKAQHLAALMSSTRTTWGTPRELFDRLHAEFNFTVDTCAQPNNAKLPRYFSPEENGLKQDWTRERCWVNPPYGRDVGTWLIKARTAALCVVLLPSRTDTRWWHDHVQGVADEVRFVRGRLRFEGAKGSAPFPSVLVIYRKETD